MEFQLCEDPEIRLWVKRQVLEDHGQQDSISERPKSRERGQKLIDFLFYNGHVFLDGESVQRPQWSSRASGWPV